MYGGFFVKKYTKLCLATFCFISSVSAFAGYKDGYKGEAPPLVPVTIPSFAGGFEFTLGAIYMTPDTSNLDYLGTVESELGSPNSVNSRIDYSVNPNYNWGFLLGLGYVFPGTSNDVKVDWMYFHNDFKSSEFVVGEDTGVAFKPGGVFDMGSENLLFAQGNVNYKFDAVDLTFGQYLNFGSRLQTRLFTGLRYMRLDDDLSTDYAIVTNRSFFDTGSVSNNFVTGEVDSSFNGLGPMVGIKADLYLGGGFSMSGGFDSALLVGNLGLSASADTATFTQSGTTAPFRLTTANNINYGFDSQQVIAPGFDAKFGLNYKYQFNNGTLLGIELGYQVTKYIDVVAQIGGADESVEEFTDASATMVLQGFDHRSVDVTNFRLAGPYLTFNVKV